MVAKACVQGLKFKAQYDEGIHVLRMFGTQHSYKGNISSLSALGEILAESGQLVQRWDTDMLEVPLDDPTKCRHPEWDQITLRQWQQKYIKSREVEMLMNFLVWTIFTVRAEEISYMWWLYYLRQGHGYAVLSDIRGGAQQDKVVGGLMQVCERLAKEIGSEHIKLRAPVQEVRQSPDGVEVSTPLGKFRASYLIVTAPPAVCSDITWSPALPPQRMELFKRYLPGRRLLRCFRRFGSRLIVVCRDGHQSVRMLQDLVVETEGSQWRNALGRRACDSLLRCHDGEAACPHRIHSRAFG
jgi:monoamine oxidase